MEGTKHLVHDDVEVAEPGGLEPRKFGGYRGLKQGIPSVAPPKITFFHYTVTELGRA